CGNQRSTRPRPVALRQSTPPVRMGACCRTCGPSCGLLGGSCLGQRSVSRVLSLWQMPAVRRVSICAGVVAVLAVGGCAALQDKGGELSFRVVPGTASWYSGLPEGVQEMDLPLTVDGAVQRIHAWWWPTAADAPAVLYLHGSRWNLTGQL